MRTRLSVKLHVYYLSCLQYAPTPALVIHFRAVAIHGVITINTVLSEGLNDLGQRTTFLGLSIGLLMKLRNFSFKLYRLS